MTVTWTQYFDQIKGGDIAPVYLFTGPEAFVKEQALARLREALLPAGLEAMNETTFEGYAPAQSIIEAAETLPFLSERRLVVVRDWPALMPGKMRNEAQDADALVAWLPRAPQSCCLVFYLRDAFDARKKAGAALSKAGRAVAFEHLPDDKLASWLQARARQSGGSIDPAAAARLCFLAGRDLTRLAGEIDKLAAYAGPGGMVTAAMVDALVTPSLESTVFQMIDCLMDRRLPRAIELTGAVLSSGETCIGILAMLTRQMRLLTHMKLLKLDGLPLPAIERQLSLNHYAATRMERQAARLSAERLEEAYRACVDADFAIKQGKARDEDALNALLFTLGAL